MGFGGRNGRYFLLKFVLAQVLDKKFLKGGGEREIPSWLREKDVVQHNRMNEIESRSERASLCFVVDSDFMNIIRCPMYTFHDHHPASPVTLDERDLAWQRRPTNAVLECPLPPPNPNKRSRSRGYQRCNGPRQEVRIAVFKKKRKRPLHSKWRLKRTQ